MVVYLSFVVAPIVPRWGFGVRSKFCFAVYFVFLVLQSSRWR